MPIYIKRLHWHWVIIRCLTNYSNILNYVYIYITYYIIIIYLLKLLIEWFIATVIPRQRCESSGWQMWNHLQTCKGIRLAGTGSGCSVVGPWPQAQHQHSKAIIQEYLRAQPYSFNLVQRRCHICLHDLLSARVVAYIRKCIFRYICWYRSVLLSLRLMSPRASFGMVLNWIELNLFNTISIV